MASLEEMQIVEETNRETNDYEQLVKIGINDRVVAKLQEVFSEGISKVSYLYLSF